jgi:F-type H+-transporting ATPase subunit epsilon
VPLRLSLVTPQRPLVDAEVESVLCPGSEVEFGVLPGHEPLLAPLAEGRVSWVERGQRKSIAIGGGFAEVTQERVVVLADSAEAVE